MNKIKELRKKFNETQTELGKIIGTDKSTVSKYENETYIIPPEVLIKIADHYGVTVDYILGRTNHTNAIDEPIAIAASTKNGIDLSDVSDADKKTIMEFIKFAKSKNKKD